MKLPPNALNTMAGSVTVFRIGAAVVLLVWSLLARGPAVAAAVPVAGCLCCMPSAGSVLCSPLMFQSWAWWALMTQFTIAGRTPL